MSVLVGGNRQISTFNNFNILRFLDGAVTIANATTYRVSDGTGFDQFTGNFIYNSDGVLIGGTITGWTRTTNGGTEFTLSGFSYPVATFLTDLETADNAGALALLFGGPDKMTGSTSGDALFTYGGNDTVSSGGGGDIVYAGNGNDLLDGGAEGDILHGEAGNDTVIGGGGGDIAYGDDNNDSVAGGAGSDILYGNAGADTVDGGAGGDILHGDTENDSILGGAGNDILRGDAGADTIAGGSGNDNYADVESIDKISEQPGQGVDKVQTSDDYTLLANFENLLLGGSGDFYGKGNSAANEITGNGGKNQLFGFDGNDTLNGSTGIDSLFGGKGDDLYFVNETADQVTEALGEGKDSVRSSAASYTLSLNIENLTLLAAAANGTGNGLANKIIGQGEDNVLDGINGNDTIDGGAGKDNILGGTERDSLLGGAGNDTLNGESSEDTLLGGEGSDVIDGGGAVDVMIGGNGSDNYYVFDSGDKIVEAAGAAGGIDTVFAFVNHTLAANVEDLELYGSGKVAAGNGLNNSITSFVLTAKLAGLGGNDEITGAGGNDTLDGGAGNDVLVGNGGNDSLAGGAGIDQLLGNGGNNTMAGGAGTDIYFVESSGDVVVETGPGIDQVFSGVDYVLPDAAAVEYFFLNAGTNATGNKFANYIVGNAGDNSLAGGGGNDTLDSGSGADSMAGGIGNDSYAFDNAGDKVTEAFGEGTDTIVTLIDNINLGVIPNVENLTLAESGAAFKGTGSGLANVIIGNSADNDLFGVGGNDTIDGRGGHDSIEGGSSNDKLTGGEGFDTLDGGIGNDTMIGGLNADHFYVDSAKDIVIEAANGSLIDQVFTKFDNTKLANNVEYLFLEGVTVTGFGNASNNRVTGNGNNNKLFGLAGNDSVFGGVGNDLLDGGAGNDSLEAGSGADTMVGGAGHDRYLIENNLGKIVEAAGGGIDTLVSDLTTADLADYVNIENLRFSTAASSVGSGNKFNNLLEGNIGSDSLLGLGGNDTLHGGAGNDTMVGDIGDDAYYLLDAGDVIVEGADAGKDTLLVDLPSIDLSVAPYQNIENVILANNANNVQGNGLANTITGNTKSNILLGGGGNDTLFGEINGFPVGSADTLSGEDGNDLMVGGRGSDWYAVEEIGDKIVEQVGQGTDIVFAGVDYTLAANVDQLILGKLLSVFAIKGTGNALDNLIHGNEASNIILGLGGNDSLNGLEGNDTIDGGAGDDTVYGDFGNDKLMGGAQSDYLQGEDGADTLIGGSGFNGLHGDAGNDSLIGGATYDTMDGGIGVDTMAGGGGQDFYLVDNLFDKVVEGVGQGDDGVFSQVDHVLSENVERLNLEGTAITGYGNKLGNYIQGNAQNNKLAGFDGNDTLSGGGSGEADTMFGGAGNDTYFVDTLTDTVDETVGAGGKGKDTIIASIDVPSLPDDIENLRLQGSATSGVGNLQNNKIEGTSGGNFLAGLDGADTLIGNNGDDTLNGGTGADSMIGGSGGDDYYVNTAGDKVVEAANGGSDLVYADINYTLAANVERLVLQNAVNGAGNGLDNVIVGNGFANKIAGLGGDDTVDSGAAADTIDGGIGSDHLMAGTENDSLIGGNGNDTLEGENGADTLIGGAGNDFLAGGDSADSMAGGVGNDTYFVNLGSDVIVESAGQGIDLVLSTAGSFTLANNVDNLNLSNAAVTGIGNGLNNLIQGANVGFVANNLQGGAGNDTLSGFGGADTLTGGAGRDTFRPSATDAIDSITDFNAGALGDTLDLSNILTGYTAGVSDANDFVQLAPGGGDTAVMVDVDGTLNGVSFVQVATLQSVTLTNVNQAVLEGNLQLD